MKTRVLYKNRIFINPENLADLLSEGALVDPDLSAVKGVPPHLWVIKRGKVLPDAKKLEAYKAAKENRPKRLTILQKVLRFFGGR